jgi:hypothetical protein
MAQYGGRTVVPLEQVCRDFFGHLSVEKLLRKALRGDIALPIVRIEISQKAQRGVHLVDLAAYIGIVLFASISNFIPKGLLCHPNLRNEVTLLHIARRKSAVKIVANRKRNERLRQELPF